MHVEGDRLLAVRIDPPAPFTLRARARRGPTGARPWRAVGIDMHPALFLPRLRRSASQHARHPLPGLLQEPRGVAGPAAPAGGLGRAGEGQCGDQGPSHEHAPNDSRHDIPPGAEPSQAPIARSARGLDLSRNRDSSFAGKEGFLTLGAKDPPPDCLLGARSPLSVSLRKKSIPAGRNIATGGLICQLTMLKKHQSSIEA